jgi:hypothetical protein
MEPGLYVDGEGNRFTIYPDGQVAIRYRTGGEKILSKDERETARAWLKWKLDRGSISPAPGLSPKRGMREMLEDTGMVASGSEGFQPPEVGDTAEDLKIPAWERASTYGEAPIPSPEERKRIRDEQEPPKPAAFEEPTTQAARKALSKKENG